MAESKLSPTADGQLAAFTMALMAEKKPNFTQWQLYVLERSMPYPINHMMRAIRLRLESEYKIDSIDPLNFGESPLLSAEDMRRAQQGQNRDEQTARSEPAASSDPPSLEKA